MQLEGYRIIELNDYWFILYFVLFIVIRNVFLTIANLMSAADLLIRVIYFDYTQKPADKCVLHK